MRIKPVLLILFPALAFQMAVVAEDSTNESSGTKENVAAPRAPLLPRWLTIHGQYRGSFEGPTGVGFVPGANDFDYLNRLRVDLTVKPLPWMKLYAQGQDSRVWGCNNPASSVQDPLELRQAYLELGTEEVSGAVARVGRQEMNYGGGRLLSAADWANTARTFEGAAVSLFPWRTKLDLVTASVIQPDMNRFDRHKPGDRITGAYLTMGQLVPGTSIEPYLFYRTQKVVVGERGDAGRSDLYIGGVRAIGKLPKRFDYQILITREWGTYASDRMLAFGGTYIGGWTLNQSPMKPRISAEFTHASGDPANGDGQRGTFDQLYGAFHYYLGAADRLGWRNSRNSRVGVDFSPVKRLSVFTDIRNLSLATVKDGLYAGNGTRSILNTNATSRHVGVETDCYFIYQWKKSTTFGAGIGHVFPGAYLLQSTKGSGYTYPYLMVTRSL